VESTFGTALFDNLFVQWQEEVLVSYPHCAPEIRKMLEAAKHGELERTLLGANAYRAKIAAKDQLHQIAETVKSKFGEHHLFRVMANYHLEQFLRQFEALQHVQDNLEAVYGLVHSRLGSDVSGKSRSAMRGTKHQQAYSKSTHANRKQEALVYDLSEHKSRVPSKSSWSRVALKTSIFSPGGTLFASKKKSLVRPRPTRVLDDGDYGDQTRENKEDDGVESQSSRTIRTGAIVRPRFHHNESDDQELQ